MSEQVIISEYYNDKDMRLKASVYLKNDCYCIDYKKDDSVFKTETYPGKSVHYVEDAAENWALGIKVLNETA